MAFLHELETLSRRRELSAGQSVLRPSMDRGQFALFGRTLRHGRRASDRVEVEAETLYEAAGLGLARLRGRWLARRVKSSERRRFGADWARHIVPWPAMRRTAHGVERTSDTTCLAGCILLPPVVGQTISHYRVTAELGAGGMGVVYRAEDLRLGRQVAIKFLPPSAAADPIALERFRREARAASALNHRHICTIHEIDEHAGRPFIVMEALEGETLQRRIGEKRASLDSVLNVMVQVAEGLEAAHAKGIVHRDIKPSNIFVTTAGEVKILDFGLAKIAPSGLDAADSSGPTVTSPGVLRTSAGETMGTISFMSPEQVRGDELDARTDIFSCGVVMYEMATGVLPFRAATIGLIFDAHLAQAASAGELPESRDARGARSHSRQGAGERPRPAVPERPRSPHRSRAAAAGQRLGGIASRAEPAAVARTPADCRSHRRAGPRRGRDRRLCHLEGLGRPPGRVARSER